MKHKPGSLEESAQRVMLGEAVYKHLGKLTQSNADEVEAFLDELASWMADQADDILDQSGSSTAKSYKQTAKHLDAAWKAYKRRKGN